MRRRGNHEGTYRPRNGYWEASVRLAGRRYWVTGKTRRECREKLQALLERHRRGQLAPPSRLTLGEWGHLWLREGEGRWRPTTLRRRQQVLSPLLERLGRLRLSRLEPLHLSAALLELQEAGMGSRSLELCWLTLHACLEEAVRRGLLGYNPCQQVGKPRHERREARDWTREEMRRFLRAAIADGRPIASLLALMLLTGLRPGEAMGLQWGDIDLNAATISIRRSVTWAGSRWHIGQPKTRAGERTITLPPVATALLSRLERAGIYLFWQERPPWSKQLSNVMRELCQRAGVPMRPAHYLRHCHATLLAASGLDVKTLQRRLGHSQASVTLDVYAHALSELDRRAAMMVEQSLAE